MNIYTTMGPTPSRVLGLLRLLITLGGEAAESELAELFHPPSLRGKDSKYPQEVIAAVTELGLTERDSAAEPAVVRIADAITSEERELGRLHDTFPRTAARLALRSEVAGEPNRFARVCAWFLAQPVGGIPVGHTAIKNRLLMARARPGWEFNANTDNRLDMVVYWAKYLGLVAQLRQEMCVGLVADPTDYFRRHLTVLLPEMTTVPIRTFRQRLGTLCPVLDGGSVRDDALVAYDIGWPEDRLSEATAFALRRLAGEGRVRLEYFNDARGDSFLRLGPDQKVTGLSRLLESEALA